jgi:hypothetical protein
VAVDIRVARGQSRADEERSRRAELREVARASHSEDSLNGSRSLERAPAQRELRLLLLQDRREDRSVARDRDVDDHGVGAPLHPYHLARERRVLHSPFEFVPAQVHGILTLDEEVLGVGVCVGEGPRDAVVVTDDHAGHAGDREADEMKIAGVERDLVPDARIAHR